MAYVFCGGVGGGVNNGFGLCVVPACFRLAGRVMDPSFPPVLCCLRAAIPLSYVLLLRSCGGMPVADAASIYIPALGRRSSLREVGLGGPQCPRVTKSVATKKFLRENVNHSGKRRTTIQKV